MKATGSAAEAIDIMVNDFRQSRPPPEDPEARLSLEKQIQAYRRELGIILVAYRKKSKYRNHPELLDDNFATTLDNPSFATQSSFGGSNPGHDDDDDDFNVEGLSQHLDSMELFTDAQDGADAAGTGRKNRWEE